MNGAPRVTLTNRQDLAPLRKRAIVDAVRGVLRREGCALDVELVFVDSDGIREVNRRFLGRRGVTDVIAFPLAEGVAPPGTPLLGEVVVCVERAISEARRRRLPLDREIVLYAIHGVLHLLGYDDHAAADIRRMRAAESEALRSAGWSGR
ncbi:MAG: rRNA maturation RNase YbeY [Planctomycetota bacterium]